MRMFRHRIPLVAIAGLVLGVGLPLASSAQEDLRPVRRPAKIEGRGRVLDLHHHQPIAGATIAVRSDDKLSYVKTDEHGRFVVEFQFAGGHQISINAPGYVSEMVHIRPGQDITVRLARGMTVAGRVVRASDGTGVAGADVTCKLEAYVGRPLVTGRTDEEGRFELDGCPVAIGAVDGSELVVSHRRHSAVQSLGRRVPGDRIADLLVEVTDGVPVLGAVTDASGKPVPNALVVAFKDYPDRLSVIHVKLNADRDGRFDLASLAPGSWILAAVAPDTGLAAARPLDLKRSTRIDIPLPRPAVIEGRLRVGKTPIPGASVRISPWFETPELTSARWQIKDPHYNVYLVTDAKGAFRAETLTPGRYNLEIEHPLVGKLTREVQTGSPILVDLPATGTAAITYFSEDGVRDTHAHGEVYVTPHPLPTPDPKKPHDPMAPPPWKRFDLHRGHATIAGLPDGEYDVSTLLKHHAVQMPARRIRIRAGEPTRIDWKLPPTTTVRGRVVSMVNDVPVPSAKVFVFVQFPGGGMGFQTTTTDAEGRFEFDEAAGTLKIKIMDPDLVDCHKTVTVGPDATDAGVFEMPDRHPQFEWLDDAPCGMKWK